MRKLVRPGVTEPAAKTAHGWRKRLVYECNVYDGSALHRKLGSSGRAVRPVKESAQEIAKITKKRNLRSPL
jgi:hypothetical protein